MSETRPIGGMIEQAMGPGGSGLSPEEEALVEIEGQAPGITDEVIGEMILTMNEEIAMKKRMDGVLGRDMFNYMWKYLTMQRSMMMIGI